MNSSLRDWLALLRAPGLGSVGILRALEQFGEPVNIFQAAAGDLKLLGLKQSAIDGLRKPDEARIDLDLAWLDQPDRHLILWGHPEYPKQLAEIPDPPAALFIVGDPEVLAVPQLAIVGSRNPTPAGKQLAGDFAAALASAGLAITSGLAAGIDAAAHRGALDVGGLTIAVGGTGPDRIYPASNKPLALDVVRDGAIITEFLPGVGPKAGHFPRRNRIISGLSIGVLVVEAAERSGSLISARLASEQGREVFAIPGSVHNPLARGCHRLIRQGAKLVETAEDILEELGAQVAEQHAALRRTQASNSDDNGQPADDTELLKVLEQLPWEPFSPDAAVSLTGLTIDALSAILLRLELAGYIASSPGGLYNRLKKV